MRRAAFPLIFLVMLVAIMGCGKQASDSDGIRAGINQHLGALKTLNLSAMDMNVLNVSVQGDQAQAQVEFRPKMGAPEGAGMQVSYSLAKQDGKWVVQNSQPAGGTIQHPAQGQDPHQSATSQAPASLPDFRNLVNSGTSNSLPPGHPPVNSQGSMPSQ